MATTRIIGWRYLARHGALMLAMGLTICALATFMASPAFADLGYAIAVVLSAACLVLVGSYLTALARSERSHFPIANYLMVGLLSIACWLVFWLLGSAPADLRLLTLLAGMHGVLWSLWYVRLAFYLKAFPAKAALLCILAATTSFLGIALATEPELTKLSAVSVTAYFTMFVGMQILLSTLYLYRLFESEKAPLRRNNSERSAVSIRANSGTLEVHNTVIQTELEETPVRATVN